MSIICLDPGTTFAITTDLPRVEVQQEFCSLWQKDRPQASIPEEVEGSGGACSMTFCLAQRQEDKKAGLWGVCRKDSQPWERFHEFRKIMSKFFHLAACHDDGPDWFLIEKTNFVRSVKQGIYALGWYAHYCEMIHAADQGFFEIETPELKTFIFTGETFSPHNTLLGKAKRTKDNALTVVRAKFPDVRNDHEAHSTGNVSDVQG